MRQIKRIAVSLVLALGALWSLGAQNRVVTGVVQDTGGAPVVGAVVMVPGTNNADVTGADGAFSIRVADAQVALEVSCLGYVTAQLNVPASQSRVDVVLQEDNMMLEETVVVGYGVQKKSESHRCRDRRGHQGAGRPHHAQPHQHAPGCGSRPEHFHLFR